jgi:hypothetical protein
VNRTKSGWLISSYLAASVAILLSTIYSEFVQCDIDKKYLGYESCNFDYFPNSYGGVFVIAPTIAGLYLLVSHLRTRRNTKLKPNNSPRIASVLAILAPIPLILSGSIGWGLTGEYLSKQCYQGGQEEFCAHGIASVDAGRLLGITWITLGSTATVLAFTYNRSLLSNNPPSVNTPKNPP